MFKNGKYRLVKDRFNGVYSIISLGRSPKVCPCGTNENPKRIMQNFINWRLDNHQMGEDILTSLFNMITYCEDLEGRKAIMEQIEIHLYYQNIDEFDFD